VSVRGIRRSRILPLPGVTICFLSYVNVVFDSINYSDVSIAINLHAVEFVSIFLKHERLVIISKHPLLYRSFSLSSIFHWRR